MSGSSAPLALRLEPHVAVPPTAMVLAAGLGKRMRPLTATRPKPLVEVAGRTLLDRTLDHLRAAGIAKAVVNVHYFADQIEAHLGARAQGLEIAISDERGALLETGGGVTRALPLIDGDPFYVVNSDNLWVDGATSSLRLLAQRWDDERMDALLLLVPLARASCHSGRGDFHMDPLGRLTWRREGRMAPYVYTGLQIVAKRLFEAAAAGALIITDDTPFARRMFGDAALYVDPHADAETSAAQVAGHFDWAAAHPAGALDLRRRAHAHFAERLCLEKLFEPLPAFVAGLKKNVTYGLPEALAARPREELPAVEYVVRVGSRPAEFVERAVASLAAQTYPRLRLVLPQFGPVAGLGAMLDHYRDRFESVLVVPVSPSPYRSTPLWVGLRAASADLVANLDDDDAVHPNHVALLVERMARTPGAGMVYSGCVQVAECGGHHYTQPNFEGPAGRPIPETRWLWGFNAFSLPDLKRFNNFIGSPAWVCRRDLLAPVLADDPYLEVAEDAFLFLSLAARGVVPQFNWWVTTDWNHRFTTQDNTTFQRDCYERCMDRVRLRTGAWFGSIVPTPPEPPPPPPPPPVLPPDPLSHTERHVLSRVVGTYLAVRNLALWLLSPLSWFRQGGPTVRP